MTTIEFAQMVMDSLPFEPTNQQVQLIAALARFCSAQTPSDSAFILNGYAGTGKTSVTAALVRALKQVGVPTVLLASTGRAAKVFANFTGMPATTIHRKIYRPPEAGASGGLLFGRTVENTHANTVFIVDEASMIGGSDSESSNLLRDLIYYVYSGENCRLIFLGDTAQLPPVGCSESPAMQPEVLKQFGLKVSRATMTKTVRQKARSGILYNATWLRDAMRSDPIPPPQLSLDKFPDCRRIDPVEMQETLEQSYSRFGEADTILITRSNRRAVDFNLAIRANILGREEMLERGERLLIAKNNYYWTQKARQEGIDFAANGEMVEVEKIYGTETSGYLCFADCRLHFPDRGRSLDAKLVLDTLTSETAALSPEKTRELAKKALREAGLTLDADEGSIRKALKESPYYNALQVKYAYAVTCHKAQGGQWASVFVDMVGVAPDALTTLDFYRWLYTAVSRATTQLSVMAPAEG